MRDLFFSLFLLDLSSGGRAIQQTLPRHTSLVRGRCNDAELCERCLLSVGDVTLSPLSLSSVGTSETVRSKVFGGGGRGLSFCFSSPDRVEEGIFELAGLDAIILKGRSAVISLCPAALSVRSVIEEEHGDLTPGAVGGSRSSASFSISPDVMLSVESETPLCRSRRTALVFLHVLLLNHSFVKP